MPIDAFEYSPKHRENLNIAVVVHRGFPVGFQVEGINHVHIVQVGSCGLIGDVDRVIERQVPDGKGFKLGVARLHAALMFLIQLAQTYGHLAAARPRCGDQHQWAGGFDIFVAPEAVIADDLLHVVGVSLDGKMTEHTHAQAFQTVFEHDG